MYTIFTKMYHSLVDSETSSALHEGVLIPRYSASRGAPHKLHVHAGACLSSRRPTTSHEQGDEVGPEIAAEWENAAAIDPSRDYIPQSIIKRRSSSNPDSLIHQSDFHSLPQLVKPTLTQRASHVSKLAAAGIAHLSIPGNAGPSGSSDSEKETPSTVTDTSSSSSFTSRVVDLTIHCRTTSRYPCTAGGFCDIYEGEWERDAQSGTSKPVEKVALKLLRAFNGDLGFDPIRARKRLNREVYVWHRLDHPNIVELFGTTYHMDGRPAIVMRWYQNGNAADYVKRHPEVDRMALIQDVTYGLLYLHTSNPPIVHCDLKGNNILIADDGRAVLCDFGLSRVIEELVGPTGNTTTTVAGAIRWSAPELLNAIDDNSDTPYPPRPTLASDVWSFACTVYELTTGLMPYHNRRNDLQIMQDFTKGCKPAQRGNGSLREPSEAMWELLDLCWASDPSARPRMIDLAPLIRGLP